MVARERSRVWWTITTESPRSTLKPKPNDWFDIEVGLRRVLHCPPNIGVRQGSQQVHGAAGTAVALPSGLVGGGGWEPGRRVRVDVR